MKANTVVVISGKVCAPTKPVPEPEEDLGIANAWYDRVHMDQFLSSCVPFKNNVIALKILGDAVFELKENHPYTVPEYEFEVKRHCDVNDFSCLCRPDLACYNKVAVIVEPVKEERQQDELVTEAYHLIMDFRRDQAKCIEEFKKQFIITRKA